MDIVMTLNIRMDKGDMEILDRRCGEWGLDRSSFVRMLIRKGEVGTDNVYTGKKEEVPVRTDVVYTEGVVDEEPSELDRVVEVSSRIEAAMNRRVEDSEVEVGEMNSLTRNQLKWEYLGLKRDKAGVEEFIKLAEKYGV